MELDWVLFSFVRWDSYFVALFLHFVSTSQVFNNFDFFFLLLFCRSSCIYFLLLVSSVHCWCLICSAIFSLFHLFFSLYMFSSSLFFFDKLPSFTWYLVKFHMYCYGEVCMYFLWMCTSIFCCMHVCICIFRGSIYWCVCFLYRYEDKDIGSSYFNCLILDVVFFSLSSYSHCCDCKICCF